jgi:protein-disulfide isomerase
MSKRQEMRERRRKAQIRNRIIVIGLVIIGAVLITFALVLPGVTLAKNASATQTIESGNPIVITPQAFTAKVDGTNMGDPNAPVKVVAYEDFRCSSCLAYTQNIEPSIIKDYVETGKVYYSYAVFIVIDGNDGTDASRRAANAALCAAAQNKFWPYHDTLYANQITESAEWFSDQRLIKMAQNVGLDMNAFNQCYQAKQYDSVITKDINQGTALHVAGTPTIFVNGTEVQNFTQTAQAIDQALAGK